jgi:hypothetical protein
MVIAAAASRGSETVPGSDRRLHKPRSRPSQCVPRSRRGGFDPRKQPQTALMQPALRAPPAIAPRSWGLPLVRQRRSATKLTPRIGIRQYRHGQAGGGGGFGGVGFVEQPPPRLGDPQHRDLDLAPGGDYALGGDRREIGTQERHHLLGGEPVCHAATAPPQVWLRYNAAKDAGPTMLTKSLRRSLDHLVGADKEKVRNCQAKSLGSFEVEVQFITGRLLHGELGRLGTTNDLIDVGGSLVRHRNEIRAKAD